MWITTERDELRELRQRAHDAGIQGNSKMTEEELRTALREVSQGEPTDEAKREAKSER